MADPTLTTIADILRQGLDQGQTPFLTISSDSMSPLLRNGDQVGLETVTPSQLDLGDVVTIVQESVLLTHRFWGLVDGRLRTKGDRSLRFDPLWPADCLLGRVGVRRRNGRMLSLTSGRGQKLNRHLTRLIMAEARFLEKKWLTRLIHRVNFILASLLVAISDRLAS